MNIIEQLKRDEGYRLKVYTDTAGKTTIGVGRNLSDVGLSDDEVDYLLANDVKRVQDGLAQFAWYAGLDPVRQGACTNLAFNLGIAGLLHFPHFLSAMAHGDWIEAAAQLRDSRLTQQEVARVARLEQQIVTGAWV